MHSRPWGGEHASVSVQQDGRSLDTYVAKHVPVHSDELGELAVCLVYLPRAAPKARRDGHRREDTVIIEQQALKSFFNKHQILPNKMNQRAAQPQPAIVWTRRRRTMSVSDSDCAIACMNGVSTSYTPHTALLGVSASPGISAGAQTEGAGSSAWTPARRCPARMSAQHIQPTNAGIRALEQTHALPVHPAR